MNDVLDAAREELARVGYRALRIEDVAARANVARTTIYRRWPTKADLVLATVKMMFDVPDDEPDTGSFRGDLLVVATRMLAFLTSANGQVLVRMVMAGGPEPDLCEILHSMRSDKDAMLERIFRRAKDRGEVGDVRLDVFLPSLIGGLHHRIYVLGVKPEAIDLGEHVDLLLCGALVRAA